MSFLILEIPPNVHYAQILNHPFNPAFRVVEPAQLVDVGGCQAPDQLPTSETKSYNNLGQ